MNTIGATNTMNGAVQTKRPQNWLLIWAQRVGLGLLITLVALTVSGATYQVIATALDARAFPPPG